MIDLLDISAFGRRGALLCLLWALLASIGSSAQPVPPLGSISGVVKDIAGQRLAGAAVILGWPAGGTTAARALTGVNGSFRFGSLPYGAYTLAVNLAGFDQAPPRAVTIGPSNDSIDFTLTLSRRSAEANHPREGMNDGPKGPPPAFVSAGIQGTIAPSGYSSGLSREEVSQVLDQVIDLDDDAALAFSSGGVAANCYKSKELLTVLRANPSDFAANHGLGDFYFAQGDFAESVVYLNKARLTHPDNLDNSGELAAAYLYAGQYADAIALLKEMADKGTKDPRVYRLMALSYAADGRRQPSIAEFQFAASVDLGAANLFACGIGLIRVGAPSEAVKLFTDATDRYPASGRMWMGLGIAQFLHEQKSQAATSLLRAADLEPEYAPSYSFLADASGVSQDADLQIRQRLAAFVIARPESAAAHHAYAVALWRQRRIDPSVSSLADIQTQLQRAIAKDPDFAEAHFLLGLVDAESGDTDGAASEFKATLKLDPQDATTHYRLAQIYAREHQRELADGEMKEFLKLHGAVDAADENPEADLRKLILQFSHRRVASRSCAAP